MRNHLWNTLYIYIICRKVPLFMTPSRSFRPSWLEDMVFLLENVVPLCVNRNWKKGKEIVSLLCYYISRNEAQGSLKYNQCTLHQITPPINKFPKISGFQKEWSDFNHMQICWGYKIICKLFNKYSNFTYYYYRYFCVLYLLHGQQRCRAFLQCWGNVLLRNQRTSLC